MGFADGRIRVTKVDAGGRDLDDYVEFAAHDNRTGRVKTLRASGDGRVLYTYGDDGNVFSFVYRPSDDDDDDDGSIGGRATSLPRSSALLVRTGNRQ